MAVPFQWRRISKAGVRFAEGVVGITSAEPCPPQLFSQLTQQGLHRLTDIYGSSETAGIGRRSEHSPDAPFELLPFWIRNEGSSLLLREDGRWFTTPDKLKWLDDRHFVLLGRKDAAVQVHGQNVHPAKIAELIKECPAVQDCAVRVMQPEEGDRLKAFVVLRPGALREELEVWIGERLTSPEQPASITFGAQLPRTESGKLADWSCCR